MSSVRQWATSCFLFCRQRGHRPTVCSISRSPSPTFCSNETAVTWTRIRRRFSAASRNTISSPSTTCRVLPGANLWCFCKKNVGSPRVCCFACGSSWSMALDGYKCIWGILMPNNCFRFAFIILVSFVINRLGEFARRRTLPFSASCSFFVFEKLYIIVELICPLCKHFCGLCSRSSRCSSSVNLFVCCGVLFSSFEFPLLLPLPHRCRVPFCCIVVFLDNLCLIQS